LRYAAIDIGSNAVRLLLCHAVEEHGEVHFKKSEFIRVPLRLGDDVCRLGRITRYRARRLTKALHAFKLLIDVFEPDAWRACATASLREAENAGELVRHIRRECGLHVEIISGQAEAELIYANHVEEQLNRNAAYLYVDVGGGSTEVSLFDRGRCVFSRSFEIGTIKWLNKLVTKQQWNAYRDTVRAVCDDHRPLAAIGTGGNINKLSKLLGKNGKPLTYARLRELYEEMKSCTLEDRMEIWRLNADRADVIVPAAKIFLSTLKAGGIEEIVVPQIGLVDGIVHRLHEKNLEGMVA
jgi:exopolyphosphatase/guanosine-5'-triphosphate,3'-diphosphate pyrophosphatase